MSRIANLKKKLGKLDCILVSSPKNRYYFTGVETSSGLLIVSKKEKADFYTDGRYITAVKASISEDAIPALYPAGGTKGAVDTALGGAPVTRIGIEESYLSASAYKKLLEAFPGVEFVDVSSVITGLRAVKSRDELRCMRKAQNIADKGFAYICKYIAANWRTKNLTEKHVAFKLEVYLRSHGSGELPFQIIVASGENSACPHNIPGDRVLREGDFVTIDFGATVDGYASDMTRTFVLGSATEKQKEIYNTVLAANEKALELLAKGVPAKEVDVESRKIINDAGYGAYYTHGLGHGVGLDVHEAPGYGSEKPLFKGAVVTDEPGIYIEGEGGVRIEDMVYIGGKGITNLAKSPKELMIL